AEIEGDHGSPRVLSAEGRVQSTQYGVPGAMPTPAAQDSGLGFHPRRDVFDHDRRDVARLLVLRGRRLAGPCYEQVVQVGVALEGGVRLARQGLLPALEIGVGHLVIAPAV